jgi:hypothetical protein
LEREWDGGSGIWDLGTIWTPACRWLNRPQIPILLRLCAKGERRDAAAMRKQGGAPTHSAGARAQARAWAADGGSGADHGLSLDRAGRSAHFAVYTPLQQKQKQMKSCPSGGAACYTICSGVLARAACRLSAVPAALNLAKKLCSAPELERELPLPPGLPGNHSLPRPPRQLRWSVSSV